MSKSVRTSSANMHLGARRRTLAWIIAAVKVWTVGGENCQREGSRKRGEGAARRTEEEPPAVGGFRALDEE